MNIEEDCCERAVANAARHWTGVRNENARLRKRVAVMQHALEAIKAHATKLRAGTDDWFEMVEFQAFAEQGLAHLLTPESDNGDLRKGT